jgi:hypothetical protein
MYKVIRNFIDKTNNHRYKVNDDFPFNKRKVAKKRLEELSTPNEKGRVYIKEIE